MDLQNNLVEDVLSVAKSLKSTVGNVAKGVRDRAKAREAQEVADQGSYWTLRPYLKSLIPIPEYILKQVVDKNISEYAVIALDAQGVGANNTEIIRKLQLATTGPMPSGVAPEVAALRNSLIESASFPGEAGTANEAGTNTAPVVLTAATAKNFLPYALGAIILGLLIYFISKR